MFAAYATENPATIENMDIPTEISKVFLKPLPSSSAVMLAIHDEKSDDQVTIMRHDYDRLIRTHMHNKIDGDGCLEIFLLKGEATEIKSMMKKFQANKKMGHVKLIAM